MIKGRTKLYPQMIFKNSFPRSSRSNHHGHKLKVTTVIRIVWTGFHYATLHLKPPTGVSTLVADIWKKFNLWYTKNLGNSTRQGSIFWQVGSTKESLKTWKLKAQKHAINFFAGLKKLKKNMNVIFLQAGEAQRMDLICCNLKIAEKTWIPTVV